MVHSAAEAVAVIKTGIPKKWLNTQECFIVLLLNTKLAPIGKPMVVALGTVNETVVSPRDVFREAVKRNATAVLVAHNHPSGDLEPSGQDEQLTVRLTKAGKLLGIQVLDHLIVSKTGCTSLSERFPYHF